MFSFQIFMFYPSREIVRLKSSNFEKSLCVVLQKISELLCYQFLDLSDINRESVNCVGIPDSYQMDDKEKQQQQQQQRLKNMSLSDEDM